MDIGSLTGKIELEDQMSAVLTKVNDLLEKFGQSATAQAKKADTFASSLKTVGQAMSIGLTAPIVAFGTAAVVAGLSVESAYNTIARKTGQTGEALASLKKDFEAVFVKVPNSAQEVGAALADVHARLGLVGVPLQNLTKQFLEFANVNQVDVAAATKTISTLMGALSEDTNLTAAEIGNAASIMDKLTYASQQSGASVTQLAHGMIQGGKAMELLGFNFNEGLALFTQFEKVGANVTDVTSSMDRVLTNLAKSGVTDLGAAFKSMVAEIENAKTEAEGIAKSVELFGAKSGRKLAEEIRGGTYAVGELSKTIENLGNVTADTAANSESFTETLGTLRNQVTMVLAPIGIELLGAFRSMIPLMVDAVKVGGFLAKAFFDLPKPIQLVAFGMLAITAAAGPAIIALGSIYKNFVLLAGSSGGLAVSKMLFTLGNTIPVLTARLWLMETAAIAVNLSLGVIVVTIAAVTAAVMIGYQAWKLYQESKERAAAADRQAVVDGDNLARIIKATGKEFKTLEEAVAWMQKTNFSANLRAVAPAADEAAESVDYLKQSMQKLRSDAMVPLSDAAKADTVELDSLGYSADKVAKAVSKTWYVPEAAVKLYLESLKKSGKGADEAAEKIKKFNEELQALGGQTAITGAQSIVKQLAAMNGPLNILPSKLAAMATALREGAQAAMLMGNYDLAGQYEMLAKTLDPIVQFQQKFNVTIGEYVTSGAVDFTADLWEQFHRLSGEVITVAPVLKSTMDVWKSMEKLKAPVFMDNPNEGTVIHDWKSQIGEIGNAFGEMFEGINSKWGQVVKVIGSGLATIATKGVETGIKIAAGFAMAASVLSELLGPGGGGKLGGAAVGALSGAAAGAGIGTLIAPGVGTAIGAGIGAAAGALMGWVAASKAAIAATAEATNKVQELKGKLVQTYGSLENLESISMRLFGMSFVGEWGHQGAEGLKKMAAFTADFEKRLAAVNAAVGKMVNGLGAVVTELTKGFSDVGTAVKTAQEKLDALIKSGTASQADLKAATDEVTKALTSQFDVVERHKQTLVDLGTQAIATFAATYLATGSYVQALAAVSPSINTLTQAYKDLGIEVEDVLLKQLMIQSTVLSGNPSLMAAIDGQAGALQGMAQMGLLNVETFGAMQRTAMQLYTRLQGETFNAAVAAGDMGDQTRNALLPMQAYLQQAAAQAKLLGIPLEDNTAMLIAQSKELGIWKDAGKSANDLLIEGITTLTGKITEMINAMLGIPSVDAPWAGWAPPPTIPDYGGDNGNDDSGGGDKSTIYAASGTPFVPRGSDTVPAMLTPGERVLTAADNQRFTEQLNTPKEGQKITVTFGDIFITGVLDENGLLQIVQRKLLPMITRSIEDNVGGARTNLQELLLTESLDG